MGSVGVGLSEQRPDGAVQSIVPPVPGRAQFRPGGSENREGDHFGEQVIAESGVPVPQHASVVEDAPEHPQTRSRIERRLPFLREEDFQPRQGRPACRFEASPSGVPASSAWRRHVVEPVEEKHVDAAAVASVFGVAPRAEQGSEDVVSIQETGPFRVATGAGMSPVQSAVRAPYRLRLGILELEASFERRVCPSLVILRACVRFPEQARVDAARLEVVQQGVDCGAGMPGPPGVRHPGKLGELEVERAHQFCALCRCEIDGC